MKKLKYIIFILTALIACSSTIQVKHDISYDKKGTRSERRNGELFINEVKIPPVFDSVTVNNKNYILITRPHTFGDHGYFPFHEKTPVKLSSEIISKEQIDKGYYIGDKRYRNTPKTWFQVKWDSTGGFLDSARINEVLGQEPFKSLPDKTRVIHLRIIRK